MNDPKSFETPPSNKWTNTDNNLQFMYSFFVFFFPRATSIRQTYVVLRKRLHKVVFNLSFQVPVGYSDSWIKPCGTSNVRLLVWHDCHLNLLQCITVFSQCFSHFQEQREVDKCCLGCLLDAAQLVNRARRIGPKTPFREIVTESGGSVS